jgi:hypothetical protein
MKRIFLLIVIIITAFSIKVRAGDPALSNEPEYDGFTYQNDRYYLNGSNDNSPAISVHDTIPTKESDHFLNGKIIRPDRKYNRYFSRDKNDFKGHLSLFEMGINSFAKTDYSGYSVPGFMDLNHDKSFEVNLRLFSYSVGLQKNNNNIGIVSGLELNLNDYRFSKPYTIVNEGGHTDPAPLDENGLSKTKLTTTFLTVPVLLELQFPAKSSESRFFISGGIMGGLKIGSHTKVIQFGDKKKSHDDFNINPFRYGASFRIGYKDLNIFVTYYKTPFFKQGRGPEMFPFTVGIGLLNK